MTVRPETHISSVEQAYQLIARQVLAFLDGRPWEEAGGKYEVTHASVSASWWRKDKGIIDERGGHPPRALSYAANDAVFFLRDNLFKTTDQRIWGLTFTLHPDGKFNIEYDYNKPEGYEETDETVDFSQALEELQKQGVEIKK